jgi:Ca2+-binding EF-hand superfamily protein
VFSTLDYMGLNIQHLFTFQEIVRVKDVIFHSFDDTLTGRLYRTSLELLFLELGFSPTHLTYHIATLDRLTTNSHVKSTMLFLW